MSKLKINYLGLSLESPLIVSSNGLSNSVEKIKLMEKSGAGAVVLKSLFEEQILLETGYLLKHNDYPEAEDYIRNYTRSNTLDNYLKHIKEAKQAVKIPIIASINCVSADDWTEFAESIQEAGADALELNIHIIPTSKEYSSKDVEQTYIDIVTAVKSKLSIPIAVKISSQFTNLIYMVERLKAAGADAVVLFNRFFEPDIDIEKMDFMNSNIFSSADDYNQALRWIGMLDGKTSKIEFSASTGVHDAEAAIRLILAGATTVQLASVLYNGGIEQIKGFNTTILTWMEKMNYETVDSFKGKMSYKNVKSPAIYERAQFMKYFSSLE